MRGVVLLIAYHFPPDNAIGGARPYRFFKYLSRMGYDCHVVTAAPQDASATPAGLIHVPDPLRMHPREGLAWQAERVGWKFILRSELVLGWSQAAWHAGRVFLNSCKATQITILSSAPPVGTHFAAWRLARYSGARWIADFRDPIHSPAGEKAVWQQTFGPAIEERILRAADLVLANTDAMGAAWTTRYPDLGEKVHVLWNGYDPEDAIPLAPPPPRARKLLSHVGELYGGRSIRPIFDGVARLIQKGVLSLDAIALRQIGEADPADLPDEGARRSAEASGWFEVCKPVPASQARAAALESDGLLLIQPHTALQVPGKLFEYLRMGRPVFAYIVPDSPVERILRKSGVPCICIYPGSSSDEVDARIMEFAGLLGGVPSAASPWFRETFDASRQTETLSGLIQSLG